MPVIESLPMAGTAGFAARTGAQIPQLRQNRINLRMQTLATIQAKRDRLLATLNQMRQERLAKKAAAEVESNQRTQGAITLGATVAGAGLGGLGAAGAAGGLTGLEGAAVGAGLGGSIGSGVANLTPGTGRFVPNPAAGVATFPRVVNDWTSTYQTAFGAPRPANPLYGPDDGDGEGSGGRGYDGGGLEDVLGDIFGQPGQRERGYGSPELM